MTELDVLERLEKDPKSMEEVGTALLRRDRRGVAAALTRWVVGAVSGLPALGALAQQTVTRAFTNTATAAIEAELAALEAEAARRAFIDDIATAVVHIGRQRVSGTGVGVVVRGSGDTPVRIDWQEVLDQGVGIRVSGRARVFIADQDVRGGVGVEQE